MESVHGSTNGWSIAYAEAMKGQKSASRTGVSAFRKTDISRSGSAVIPMAVVERLDRVAHRVGVEGVEQQALGAHPRRLPKTRWPRLKSRARASS
jgi:hypothetical protein